MTFPTRPQRIQSGRPTILYAELVALNLQLSINSLLLKLLGGGARDAPLRIRWIEAYFPFTSPGFEVEILGRRAIQQLTFNNAGEYLHHFLPSPDLTKVQGSRITSVGHLALVLNELL